MTAPFTSQREAALALLNSGTPLSRKGGSFAGQLCCDPTPMSPAQRSWLAALLEKAGLPPLVDGGEDA